MADEEKDSTNTI